MRLPGESSTRPPYMAAACECRYSEADWNLNCRRSEFQTKLIPARAVSGHLWLNHVEEGPCIIFRIATHDTCVLDKN